MGGLVRLRAAEHPQLLDVRLRLRRAAQSPPVGTHLRTRRHEPTAGDGASAPAGRPSGTDARPAPALGDRSINGDGDRPLRPATRGVPQEPHEARGTADGSGRTLDARNDDQQRREADRPPRWATTKSANFATGSYTAAPTSRPRPRHQPGSSWRSPRWIRPTPCPRCRRHHRRISNSSSSSMDHSLHALAGRVLVCLRIGTGCRYSSVASTGNEAASSLNSARAASRSSTISAAMHVRRGQVVERLRGTRRAAR